MRSRNTHHDIVEKVPRQVSPCNHRSRDQRAENSTGSINTMQKAEQFIGIGHVSNPGIPCGILEAITKPGKDKCDHEDGVWWRRAVHDVGNEMASWSDQGYASLTEGRMDAVVEEGCKGIAHERR